MTFALDWILKNLVSRGYMALGVICTDLRVLLLEVVGSVFNGGQQQYEILGDVGIL
jgi:hypothetical protein